MTPGELAAGKQLTKGRWRFVWTSQRSSARAQNARRGTRDRAAWREFDGLWKGRPHS